MLLLAFSSTDIAGRLGNPLLQSLIVIGDEGERLVKLGLPVNPNAEEPDPVLGAAFNADAGETIVIPVQQTPQPAQNVGEISPTIEAAPTPAEAIQGVPPDTIIIPSIGLAAPVEPVHAELVTLDGVVFEQWQTPDRFAAGWQDTSALLGLPGNTVLSGHNNIYGEVFGWLSEVSVGDEVLLRSGEQEFHYQITNKMILPEKYESLNTRMENAQWLRASNDERLTLVTCWPKMSNSHRLIVVAKPIQK